jgi:glycosyltransferase involved in cell wall biosynthesis
MDTISVYGAGRVADQMLSFLKTRYDVRFVMDKDKKKHGKQIQGVVIVDAIHENACRFPVVILIADIEGALRSLNECGCDNPIWLPSRDAIGGWMFLFEYIAQTDDFRQNLFMSIAKPPVLKCIPEYGDFANAEINETGDVFDPAKPRVFNLCLRPYDGALAGPLACNRNLRMANQKYGMLRNFISVNLSEAYVPKGCPCCLDNSDECVSTDWFAEILSGIEALAPESVLALWREHISGVESLLSMHRAFKFNKDDVFLLQGSEAVSSFVSVFQGFRNIWIVYHNQGSLASESNQINTAYGNFLDKLQTRHLQNVHHWVFPSWGAVDGFLATANGQMLVSAQQLEVRVAYNGFEPKRKIYPDSAFRDFLIGIPEERIVFCSASILYKNKGVERIPAILTRFKQATKKEIFWILVGNGPLEKAVSDAIDENLKEDEYIWIKERFENQDNIFALFKRADFYIMMHHVSIFDLSTLQSMAYGCTPILSNIGGNKEFIAYQNGILLNPDEPSRFPTIDAEYLHRMRKLNENIVRDNFDDKAFLKGYRRILKGMEHTMEF